MTEILEDVERDISDKFMEFTDVFGINPTIMKVYTTLFFSLEPLGLSEIAKKTGYSVSTVCNNVAIAEKLLDVRKIKKPGSKKVFFECQHDVGIIERKKSKHIKHQMESVIRVLKSSEKKLSKSKDMKTNEILGYIKNWRIAYEKCMLIYEKLGDGNLLQIEEIK